MYAYNVQPGVEINYANGDSWLADDMVTENSQNTYEENNNITTYVINKNSKKIHLPDCGSVKEMRLQNKKTYKGTIEELFDYGYEACKSCIEK